MATRTLQFLHLSMRHAMPDSEADSDIEWTMSQGADLISYDEVPAFHDNLRRIGRKMGYRTVNPGYGGEAIAINTKTCTLKDVGQIKGSDKISDGISGPARYIGWVRVTWHGESVWLHTAHWPYHLVQSAERRAAHDNLSKMMVRMVQEHGKGGNLSFFSGDINDDDGAGETRDKGLTNTRFTEGRLVTIWDEMRNWPGTHGNRTIDVIGKYDPDRRVTGIRGKAYPLIHTDHRPIGAWYDVERVKEPGAQTPTGGGGTGGGGGKGGKDNPTLPSKDMITGGNVSWKDYRDNNEYQVDRATETGPDDVSR